MQEPIEWSNVQCPPVGPRDARIVIVGEAPGEHEVISREPFVGASGRLLNQMLAAVGIDRSSCYLTNVYKNRPANNEFGNLYEPTKNGKLDTKRKTPKPVLVEALELLHRELCSLRPNIIICLGNEPLRAVANRRGIDKWRGSLLSTQFGKCIATYHPAYLLRVYKDRVIVEHDLRRACGESTKPELELPRPEFILRPRLQNVLDYLKQPRERISFDIETLTRDQRIYVRCLGLSDRRNHAICIPFVCQRGNAGAELRNNLVGGDSQAIGWTSYWSRDEERQILEALNALFLNKSIRKIAQNFPFDSTVLAREFGFDIRGEIDDTMLKHHTLYCELPKGLDFLCSLYTRHPYYSDYNSNEDMSTWTYNCYDACVTLEVDEVESMELQEAQLTDFYRHHIVPTMLAVTRAQNRGVLIDESHRKKLWHEYDTKAKELTAKLRQISEIPELNPSSTKQMASFLYTKMGLKPVLHHKTKNVTTGKDAMEKLAQSYPEHAELFNTLREHSSAETLRDGFLSIELKDGRIRTSFNTAGTVTGRLASSRTFLAPSTNLQNIRKSSAGTDRRCFMADPGWSIIKADYSQAEFRIVAWLAKIGHVIRKYAENPQWDVHKWVASLIYRKPETEILKEERNVAKNGVYGGNYKMHYVTAARTYKLSLELAKFVLAEYRRAIPEIPQWWGRVEQNVRNTRTLVNPFGRKRILFGRVDDDMYRSAYSHEAQSIVADETNRAIILVDEFFDPLECHMLLQVHDELVLQARNDCVEYYAKMLVEFMEFELAFPDVEQPLVIPAEVTVGPNWYDQTTLDKRKGGDNNG